MLIFGGVLSVLSPIGLIEKTHLFFAKAPHHSALREQQDVMVSVLSGSLPRRKKLLYQWLFLVPVKGGLGSI